MGWRGIITLLGCATLGGCIFFVEEAEEFSSVCDVAGPTKTQCAACARENCANVINACCGSDSCSGTLRRLEQCTTAGGGPACGEISAFIDPVGDPLGAAVGAGLASTCARACPSGEPLTGCTTRDDSCSCDGDDTPNNVVCDNQSFQDAVCCADLGWPGSGLDCRCDQLRCRQTSDGCECSVNTSGPLSRCSAGRCCVSSGRCECGSRDCYSFETEVSECSAAAVGCSISNRERRASCSVRTE